MDILMLTSTIPSPTNGTSLPPYYRLRILGTRHRITLLSLREKGFADSEYLAELGKYCVNVETFDVPPSRTLARRIQTLLWMASPEQVFSSSHTYVNTAYSPAMQKRVNEITKEKRFDLIFAQELWTAFYAWEANVPKIVDFVDAIPEGCYRGYLQSRQPMSKLVSLLLYLSAKRETRNIRDKGFAAACIQSENDKKLLERYLSGFDILVVPNGVDTDYFSPQVEAPDFPSLIFVGKGKTDAIVYFYKQIYPLVKREFPEIKFYIVGDNLGSDMHKLHQDKSVKIIGFVPDVRSFLSKASVVVVPMLNQMGISNKILEAMAMCKPVVSTSIGCQGINVTSNRNIMIGDDPEKFAENVVLLLKDEELRRKIGIEARELVQKNYTWKKAADTLDDLFTRVVAIGDKGKNCAIERSVL